MAPVGREGTVGTSVEQQWGIRTLTTSRTLLDQARDAVALIFGPRRTPQRRPAPAPVSRPYTPLRTTGPAPAPTAPAPEAPAAPTAPSPAAPVAACEDVLSGVCASVALRDLNLVDALLATLETMEAREEDPDTLAELYRLDHLATRLRRNAENLRVLSGRDVGDALSETTSLVDVVRAAMSAIEQYARVAIGQVASVGVVGFAADDLGRLLAEILDNATANSPPNTPVRASAHLTEQGSVLVRIEDDGIGLPPERLTALNERLTADPVLDGDSVRHMGLAVVRRIAVRHGMRVWLDRRQPHGTVVSVVLPSPLVSEIPGAMWSGGSTVVYTQPEATPAWPQAGQDVVPDAPPPVRPAQANGSSLAHSAPPVAAELRGAPLPRRAPRWDDGGPRAGHTAPPPAPPRPVAEPDRTPPPPAEVGGMTTSGLPRRVPRSLRNPAGATPAAPEPAPVTEPGSDDDYARLISDLGAFAEGERTARDEQAGSTGPEGTQA
jgi:anti-sigma regulatory factor (Ser/Thr protein kinase)